MFDYKSTRLLFGVALTLAFSSGTVRAGSILKFRLSNQGTESIGRIDFDVMPPGAVAPPAIGTDPATGEPLSGSPLTILPESTGFDSSQLSVALGTKPGAQALRLLFGQTQTIDANGDVVFSPVLGSDGKPLGQFEPGSRLDFALTVDSNKITLFDLILPQMAAGLVLQDLPTDSLIGDPAVDPPIVPTTPTPDVNQVPEPGPLAVWGVVAGLAIWRTQRRRRHRIAG